MQYLHNKQYGFMLYPESIWDIIRLKIVRLLLPDFKRTWKGGGRYWKSIPTHTIEVKKVKETEYPDLCSAG